MTTNLTERSNVVARAEWLAARKELLLKEKQLTRQRDEIDRQRRALPWVKVEKKYVFDGAWPTFLRTGASSLCRTSCSAQTGKRFVWAARSARITSTAR